MVCKKSERQRKVYMICVSRDIKYEVFYPKKYERKIYFSILVEKIDIILILAQSTAVFLWRVGIEL